MKDRYRRSAPVPSGYRDIKFFLSFCTNPENPFAKRYHVCELQLNLTTMVIAKELEHPLYDILRQAGSRDHPTPVTITSPQEIERLGAKLRSVWVTLKQRQILSSAGDLAAFRGLVAKFFRDGDPAAGPITVSVNEIRMLQRLTPEIYEAYTKLSLDAKVMGPSGLRSMTTYRQQNAMTKPKGR
jgi:hypothetical protein